MLLIGYLHYFHPLWVNLVHFLSKLRKTTCMVLLSIHITQRSGERNVDWVELYKWFILLSSLCDSIRSWRQLIESLYMAYFNLLHILSSDLLHSGPWHFAFQGWLCSQSKERLHRRLGILELKTHSCLFHVNQYIILFFVDSTRR